VTSEESAEIKRLKRENAELRRANEILKAASAFFAAWLADPPFGAVRLGPVDQQLPLRLGQSVASSGVVVGGPWLEGRQCWA
jgi:hypothetical protein